MRNWIAAVSFNVLSHITVPFSTKLLDLEGNPTFQIFAPLSTVVNVKKISDTVHFGL